MNKLIITFLLAFPLCSNAHVCKTWEYGNFSFSSFQKIKNDELLGTQYYVFWSAPNISASWMDNDVLAGNITVPLKKYFKVNSINPTKIMNSLGQQGWEAYSYQKKQDKEDRADHYNINFKKCKG